MKHLDNRNSEWEECPSENVIETAQKTVRMKKENKAPNDERILDEAYKKQLWHTRTRRRWRGFLAIYSFLFLLLGAVGCYVLYRFSESYEKSIPEHVMDDLMASTAADGWYDTLSKDASLFVTEFEDGEALFREYYDATIRNASFSYRKAPGEYSNKTPIYHVRAAGINLCKVTLIPKGKNAAGFGRQLWQVGSIEACNILGNLESVTVEIDAPQGDEVFINGIQVDATYLTDEKAPCPDMNPLENRFAEVPYFSRYRVDAMYGKITVTDASGRELPPEIDRETGVVRYTKAENTFFSLAVRAPEGVAVSVSGAEFTAADATKNTKGILEGLEKYTGGKEYHMLWYTYDKLYSSPGEIIATYNGQPLTPLLNEKGELIYFYPGDSALKETMSPVVENFFNRYIEYSAKAYNDKAYLSLLACILPGTELYTYIHDSVDAMYWASATEVRYDKLIFEDFYPVGDHCFTCTIRYKAGFSAVAWHESYSYDLQNAYELAFVKEGDVWYAAAMSAVAG